MSKHKRNWQLMTVDQIAQVLLKLEEQGDTTVFRVQKNYYKNNPVMLDRLAQAENLVKIIKQHIQQELERLEKL